jgi:phosphopentomutase
MVVHPGGLDYTGHQFGGESPQYRNQALAMDDRLAQVVPQWLAGGYDLLITADHGMNADGQHGGTSRSAGEVPLFCLSDRFEPGLYVDGLSQLAIAPLICQLLSLPLTENMRSIPVPGFREVPELAQV